MIKVTENFRKIQDLLHAETLAAGRPQNAVRLLAVSKRQPVRAVQEAAEAGQRDFGENFVKEGLEKMSAVGRDDLTWHFIGHLQSNKTRPVAEHFDWVHTLDRLRTAQRLSEQRPHYCADLNVCIQVNVDDEQSKAGVGPEAVAGLAAAVANLPRLRLRGLMCIPSIQSDAALQRQPFAELRRLLDTLNESGLGLDTLSMGMSADYAAAIREGSTIVRIGTALFGKRDAHSDPDMQKRAETHT